MPLTGNELEVPVYVRLANGTIYRAGVTGLSKGAADGLYLPLAGGILTGAITHAQDQGNKYDTNRISHDNWGDLVVEGGDGRTISLLTTDGRIYITSDDNVEIDSKLGDVRVSSWERSAFIYGYDGVQINGRTGEIFLSCDGWISLSTTSGIIDAVGSRITSLGNPVNDTDAVNKRYSDLATQGFSFKSAVRVVATGSITQSGTQTIDGVAVAVGNRVLCAGQSAAGQNGIWVVAAGAWTRSTDMDGAGELKDGALVPVAEGATHADTQFICTSIGADPWFPGTSSTWTRYSGVADVTAGLGMIRNGQALDIQSANAAHMTVGADSLTIVSAPKWTTPRNITFTGDVTGSVPGLDGTSHFSTPLAIAAGVIVDNDVNASAAIATTKLAPLRAVSTISGATTALAVANTDYVYVCSAALTLTLPTAVDNTNMYTVKRTGTGNVTVATTASQTIDGAASFTIDVQYQSVDLVSDGSSWVIV